MTIVLCGGGSGGHITPLLAVAHELKKVKPGVKLIYLGERGGKFNAIISDNDLFDEQHYISAGKFRRYHNESLIKKIIDLKTIALNFRDLWRVARGVIQSVRLFRKLGAEVVFLKGGYVCVPASLGARFYKIPMITHDSDAVAGISNRLAARFAKYHAVATPIRNYKYSQETIKLVGLPVSANFRPYSNDEQKKIREDLGIDKEARVLLITGGSNGAHRLNAWCISALPRLLDNDPKLHIIHVIGKGNKEQYDNLEPRFSSQITVLDFTSELYIHSAIADVIITRAGATALAEFASQSRACIVVPNPDLTGGHQLKNAEIYENQKSIVVIQENDLESSSEKLAQEVQALLDNPNKRSELAKNMHATLPKTPAARAIADLLIEVAGA